MSNQAGTPMTLADHLSVTPVVEAAIHNSRVKRLIPDDEGAAGHVVEGTARRIGDENGCSTPEVDVRDLHLWVTLDSGFEAFWPVSKLMDEARHGTFVAPGQPPAPMYTGR